MLSSNVLSIDSFQIIGRGENKLIDCEVEYDAVLGDVCQVFAYAQTRLEQARISHFMGFIGCAVEITQNYVNKLHSLGQPLASLKQEQEQAKVIGSYMGLHASRPMPRYVAALMDVGQPVTRY